MAAIAEAHPRGRAHPGGRGGRHGRPALVVVPGGRDARAVPGGRHARPPARVLRRRRRAALAAVVAVAVAVGAVAGFALARLVAEPSPPPSGTPHAPSTAAPADGHGAEGARTHVVQPGDTLWSIAREAAGGDVRATVDRLAARNGGARLEPGQRVVLD